MLAAASRIASTATPLQIALAAPISTSSTCGKNVAGKFYNRRSTIRNFKDIKSTYDMHRRPHKIGHHKTWMTWHTHNLDGFKQSQGLIIAQDEIIRRFCRATLFDFLPTEFAGPTELVIKRRGNCVFVTGFLTFKGISGTNPGLIRLYWIWGFTEEILANVLKQPVKLELQFVRTPEELVEVVTK